MFAKERQNQIELLLHRKGAVTTAMLTEQFGVSMETVRRDLLEMEREGRLTRVHGGAVTKSDMKPWRELSERNREHRPEKLALARKAVELLSDGDILALDSGSTAIAVAEVLARDACERSLTVFLYSLDVFEILRDRRNLDLILLGGQYQRQENSFYGDMISDALENLHIPKLFLMPTALSLSGGICEYNRDSVQVQRALLRAAEQVYVLADSSKFEKKALLTISPMRREYIYITDSGLSEELRAFYRENGLQVLIGENKNPIKTAADRVGENQSAGAREEILP